MTETDLEREWAYIKRFKQRNEWLERKLTVKLTAEQVETMLSDAFRAGVKSVPAATSVAEKLFGQHGFFGDIK